VLPPATTNGGAFAIRKQVIKEMSLDDYRKMGSFNRVKVSTAKSSRTSIASFANFWTPEKSRFHPRRVKHRYTMLLSRHLVGKDDLLNAISEEVPPDERIITIEDTREVKPLQKNFLPLVARRAIRARRA